MGKKNISAYSVVKKDKKRKSIVNVVILFIFLYVMSGLFFFVIEDIFILNNIKNREWILDSLLVSVFFTVIYVSVFNKEKTKS